MSVSRTAAEEAVVLFEQAGAANRQTRALTGNVVQLTAEAADDVVVSGDLHGHRANFEAILRFADLEARPRRHLILQEVWHGGPSHDDGGCMSHRMLEDVARLKLQYPERVHFLISNHELAELTDYPIMKARKMLNILFRTGLQNCYGSEAERVRLAAIGFIGTCPAAARIGQRVFVSHSLPERGDHDGIDVSIFSRSPTNRDQCEGGALFRMVWGRDFRHANAEAYARAVNADVLIHGHEPCAEGFRVLNDRQIILDCCGPRPHIAVVPTSGDLSFRAVAGTIRPLAPIELE